MSVGNLHIIESKRHWKKTSTLYDNCVNDTSHLFYAILVEAYISNELLSAECKTDLSRTIFTDIFVEKPV